jgi:MoxR-like ATPase
MLQNIVTKIMIVLLAVGLFAPVVAIAINQHEERPTPVMETSEPMAELPEFKPPMSRHAFKRAVHRLELASKRKNLKGALLRRVLNGTQSNDSTEENDTVEIKTGLQCADCGCLEEHGYAIDEELNPAQCADCYYYPTVEEVEITTRKHAKSRAVDCFACGVSIHQGETKHMMKYENMHTKKAHCDQCADEIIGLKADEIITKQARSQSLSALIAPIFLALVVSIFAPKLAFSVPFLAVGKMHLSAELEACKAEGYKIRSHSKSNPAKCISCKCEITKGELKAMLPYAGYTQNKAHCRECAHITWVKISANPTPKVEPKTDPVPEPKPEPATQPNEPTAPKVAEKIKTQIKGDKGSQLVELIAQLGGVDEAEVRRIVNEETAQIQEKFADQINDQLSKISKPTLLEIKPMKGEKIKIEGVQHHKMTQLLFYIMKTRNENNLYLWGDAGTGKTRICVDLFGLLKAGGWFKEMGLKKATVEKNVFILSCNKDIQSQELLGRESPRFFDDGSGRPAGEWDFILGALLPVFRDGGIICLDEIDRLHESTLSALNAILANGFVYTPKGEKIVRHPACVIVGTANTKGNGGSGKYSATRQQDGATLDRFTGRKIHIDYDPAIEDSIAGSAELAQKFRDMRNAFEAHGLDEAIISYRSIIVARNDIEAGISQEYALYNIASQWGEENAFKAGFTEVPTFDFSSAWGGA